MKIIKKYFNNENIFKKLTIKMFAYTHQVSRWTLNHSGILRNTKQYHTTCYTVMKRDTVIQTRGTETYTRGTLTGRGYLTHKQVIFKRGKSPFSTNGGSSYREMLLTSYDSWSWTPYC